MFPTKKFYIKVEREEKKEFLLTSKLRWGMMAPLILARIRKGSHVLLRMALNWLSVQASDSSTSSQEQSVTIWLICKPLDLLYLTFKVSVHSGVVSINLFPFEVKPNHFSYTDTSSPLKIIPDSARGTNKYEYYPYIQKVHFCSVLFSCRVLVLYPTNYGLLYHRKKKKDGHHIDEKEDFYVHGWSHLILL